MEQYYGIVRSDEYLEHFGIKGQKWGVRRYQNEDGSLTETGRLRYSSAEQRGQHVLYKTKLNDLDKNRAEHLRDISDQETERRKYERRASKAKTDEKHDEYRRKADELGNKTRNNLENIKKIDSEIQSILKKATSEGYSVKSQDFKRNTVRGKSVAAKLLTHLAASAVLLPTTGLAVVPIGDKWVPGTKYKVSKNRTY